MDGGSREKEEGSTNCGFKRKQRTEVETNLLMVQYSTISGVSNESVGNNIITNFRHAWRLSKVGLTKVIQKFIMNGGVTNRKEREDKGGSVFTCEKRRKAEFTPYKEFKKKRSQDWRDSMVKLTASELKSEWDQLYDSVKKVFIDKADKKLLRGTFLANDLYENLRQTHGIVTWCGLEDRMNNIVSHETIRLHIKSIEDFTYRASRIFIMLDPQEEHRKVH